MSLPVFEHITDVNRWVTQQKESGLTVGFVPTMGALHAGHQSLIALARQHCNVVIASIFVNPTQFNNASDLERYPRTLQTDLDKLAAAGCDAAFCPSVEEMYPKSDKGHWDFGPLSNSLEGKFRPGHFDGVLTIVRKLFAAIQPDKAFFGEKDFQQLALIRRMTCDERLPIEIIASPTIREANGLAMSSRNMRLNEAEIRLAAHISRILFATTENARSKDPRDIVQEALRKFAAFEEIQIEYVELVEANTFNPVVLWPDSPCVLLVACFIGDVRLIDNVIIR